MVLFTRKSKFGLKLIEDDIVQLFSVGGEIGLGNYKLEIGCIEFLGLGHKVTHEVSLF